MSTTTFHPDFPKETPVIGLRQGSSYFGERGVVYGSGPNSSGTQTLVWVRWDHNGDCLKHLPRYLAVAAKDEAEYKTSSKTNKTKSGSQKITHHVIPSAGKRARPTLFERIKQPNQNPAREA